MTTLEICIDHPDGLDVCARGGADRIELCAALAVGGLTPSAGLMAQAAHCEVPAHAMIRPVAGGFVPSDQVFAAMLADVSAAQSHGLAGVVVGVLTGDGALDARRLAALMDAAGHMEVTLHRAIDLCVDPLRAIDVAARLGIARILTSGAALTAPEGAAAIARMVAHAQGRLTVMAGSGVTAENVGDLRRVTGVTDVHASCGGVREEAARVAAFGFGPAQRRITDLAKIKAMRDALDVE